MAENKEQWLSPDGLDILLTQLRTKLDELYINPEIVENKVEITLLSSKQYTDRKIAELKGGLPTSNYVNFVEVDTGEPANELEE